MEINTHPTHPNQVANSCRNRADTVAGGWGRGVDEVDGVDGLDGVDGVDGVDGEEG